MSKVALITGSTDGIGRETAIELARAGYTIHLFGRNQERGDDILSVVQEISPQLPHRLYISDLSTKEGCYAFLDEYKSEHKSLDILVLNANILSVNTKLTVDGVNNIFAICYLSRYLFSVYLDELLQRGDNPRILHVGGASTIHKIKYNKLSNTSVSPETSMEMGFMGCCLLTQFANSMGLLKTPCEFYEPGIVNTNTIKSQGTFVQLISRVMGMIEPEEAGRRIVEHINTVPSGEVAGKFYNNKGEREAKDIVIKGQEDYENLIAYSDEFDVRMDEELSNGISE